MPEIRRLQDPPHSFRSTGQKYGLTDYQLTILSFSEATTNRLEAEYLVHKDECDAISERNEESKRKLEEREREIEGTAAIPRRAEYIDQGYNEIEQQIQKMDRDVEEEERQNDERKRHLDELNQKIEQVRKQIEKERLEHVLRTLPQKPRCTFTKPAIKFSSSHCRERFKTFDGSARLSSDKASSTGFSSYVWIDAYLKGEGETDLILDEYDLQDIDEDDMIEIVGRYC